VASTSVEDTVDSTHGVFGGLDLAQVDRLHEAGLGGELGGVVDTACGGDELASTTVNGISMEGDVKNVEADSTHVLVTEDSLLGGPLEGTDAGVFDFIHVLDTLGDVNKKIGTSSLGAEAPDLTSIGGVPAVFFGEDLGSVLGVVLGVDGSGLDLVLELGTHGEGLDVEPVVFVGGLGETDDIRLFNDSLTEGDDRVGLLEGDSCVVLFEILQADFEMKFTGSGDDVFTRLFGVALDAWV